MKKLSELYEIESDVLIEDIKINSQLVEEGDIFVCTMGVNADRHDFIDDAIKKGAAAIVVSKDVGEKTVPIIKVEDTNLELPKLSAKFYDYPEKELTIIGVTGTDGKTTTGKTIQNLIGDDCAYLGTLGAHYKNFDEGLNNTTPDSNLLFKYFRKFVDLGIKYVVMETSSEAFYRKRLDYFTFDYGVITNVTGDHLNVHKTMDNYVACKQQLFKQVKNDGFIVLNKDDNYYEQFKDLHENVYTYSKTNQSADLLAKDYQVYEDHSKGVFVYENREYPFVLNLIGEYNISNISAVLLLLGHLGFNFEELVGKIDNLEKIPGRGDFLDYGQDFKILLDYAHTIGGFKALGAYLKTIDTNKVYLVFGSAGGREKEKRPTMGEVALNNSYLSILTAEDPRFEKVSDINADILSTTTKTNYLEIEDRKEAIHHALSLAEKGDLVAILGKAGDRTMQFASEVVEFSDYEAVESFFKK